MPAAPLGALLAIALAAPPGETLLAANLSPQSTVMGAVPPTASVVMNALPPAPTRVVRETRTFGTVTLDHAAHLARKISCRTCHGGGPVSKIERMAPRQAHDLCRSCHVELARGPTDCRGCHVVAPPPQTVTAMAPAPSPTPAPAHAPAPGAGPEGSAAAGAARAAGEVVAAAPASPASGPPPAPGGALPPPPPPPADAAAPISGAAAGAPGLGLAASTPFAGGPGGVSLGPLDDARVVSFHRVLEAGFALRAGPDQGARGGVAVRLTSREDRVVMVHSLEWSGGLRDGRTLLLIGGGSAIPVQPRLAVLLVAMGGVDAVGQRSVEVMPALGASAGLQWTRAVPWLDTLGVTVSGVSDLVRRRNEFGERVGDLTFALTVAGGMRLER